MLDGDMLPTNHFQMSHQQLMLSDCKTQRNLSAVELSYVPAPFQLQFRNHQEARGFSGISRALDISPSSAHQTPSDLERGSNYRAGPALSRSLGPVISRDPVQPHVPCDSSGCFVGVCWPAYANGCVSERSVWVRLVTLPKATAWAPTATSALHSWTEFANTK